MLSEDEVKQLQEQLDAYNSLVSRYRGELIKVRGEIFELQTLLIRCIREVSPLCSFPAVKVMSEYIDRIEGVLK